MNHREHRGRAGLRAAQARQFIDGIHAVIVPPEMLEDRERADRGRGIGAQIKRDRPPGRPTHRARRVALRARRKNRVASSRRAQSTNRPSAAARCFAKGANTLPSSIESTANVTAIQRAKLRGR